MYPFQWVLYEVNSINQIKELFITFNFRSGPLYNTSLTWTKYYLLQDQLLFIYTCVHTKIFRDPQIFIRLNLNSRALLWQIYYTPSKSLPSNCIKTGNSRNLREHTYFGMNERLGIATSNVLQWTFRETHPVVVSSPISSPQTIQCSAWMTLKMVWWSLPR